MVDPVLITTPTRPFGWAMSDLTLFGAQPTPGMVIGRAPPETIVVDEQDAPLPADEAGGGVDVGEPSALLGEAAADAGSAEAPPVPVTTIFHPNVAAAEALAPVTPGGSGGFVAATVVTPLHVNGEGEGPGAAVAAPIAGTPGADAEPLAQLNDISLPQTIDALAGVVEGPVAPVAQLPDVAGDALGKVADVAHSAVATVPLDSFGGSDPAAGLSTLVGMVQSADTFHLGQTVASAADPGSGSILDALASDALPSPLLGDDHHATGDLAIDDHSIHVGL